MANQHESPKGAILKRLRYSRDALDAAWIYRRAGEIGPHAAALRSARFWLRMARGAMAAAPASTRRRWKCGK